MGLSIDASVQVVSLAVDKFAQKMVPSLPASYLAPNHVDVAPAAGYSVTARTAVGLVEALQEESWRPMSRPHPDQALVCAVFSAELEEN